MKLEVSASSIFLLFLSYLSGSVAVDEADCDQCEKALPAAAKCHEELKANLRKYSTMGVGPLKEICCTLAKGHACIIEAAELCVDGSQSKQEVIAGADMFLEKEGLGKCKSYKYGRKSMPFACKMVFFKGRTIGWIVGGIIIGLSVVLAVFLGLTYYRKKRLRQTSSVGFNLGGVSS
jgi:hypothetical protein